MDQEQRTCVLCSFELQQVAMQWCLADHLPLAAIVPEICISFALSHSSFYAKDVDIRHAYDRDVLASMIEVAGIGVGS